MSLRPRAFDGFPADLERFAQQGPGRYLAVVDRVHDGDTFHALVLCGFGGLVYVPVRMRGINAPELTSQDASERARAIAAREHLRLLMPPGTRVVLEPLREVTSFQRYVAYTYDRPDRELGVCMLLHGFAVPMLGLPGEDEA